MFDVNVSTIKRWVDKGILDAHKTPGGHRRISKLQLRNFVTRLPREDFDAYTLKRLQDQSDGKTSWQDYYRDLKDNKTTQTQQFIQRQLLSGSDTIDIINQVLLPTLHEIGRAWRQGDLEIHEEHRMSFLIREHIFLFKEHIPEPGDKSPLAILACAKQENHEIPLHLAEVILKENGWRYANLGINISTEQVIAASNEFNADLISIFSLYTPKSKNKLDDRKKLVDHVKTKDKRLVLAGAGWEKQENMLSDQTFYSTDLELFDCYLKNKRE